MHTFVSTTSLTQYADLQKCNQANYWEVFNDIMCLMLQQFKYKWLNKLKQTWSNSTCWVKTNFEDVED